MSSWRDWRVTEYLKINAVRRMFGLLGMRRLEIWLLVIFATVYAVFEGIGIALLLPVLQYAQQGKAAIEAQRGSFIWGTLLHLTDLLHVPLNLVVLLILAFIPIMMRQVAYFLSSWYAALAQSRAVARMRRRGFDALAAADTAFFTRRDLGDMVGVLTGQTEAAGGTILQFAQLIATVALLLLYAGALMLLSPLLTGIAVGAVLILSVVIRSNVRRSRVYGTDLTHTMVRVYTRISERLSLMALVRMLGQEKAEGEAVTAMADEVARVTVRINIAQALTEVTVDPGLMFAAFVVLLVGVDTLHFSLAGLGVFLFVLLRLNTKAKEFSGGRMALSAGLESLLYVNRTIDEAYAAQTIVSGSERFVGVTRAIQFDDVGFSYANEGGQATAVLQQIEARLPAGSMTALVGRSGAGKSTLVSLLPRLRDTTVGRVLIDGRDLRDFDLHSLRRGIGYMTQDALLFSDTVYSNLIYGLERVPIDDEVQVALRSAYAEKFVDQLPEGLQTRIGDRGVRLSGGERQRLCLARVLLQDPGIIILDEPTSSLDSESEQSIQQALDDLHGTRTIIVIAHRLSTVRKADQLLVLDDGRIAERGTHEQLLAKHGVYEGLFRQQMHD
ncbi:MAG: ABC transporter ATP-binding protein [Thermoleophilia bacterium]